jgi:F0F1-type ATP synthase assembly protein I
MPYPPRIPIIDRLRLIGYGGIGGLIVGAFLGWMFHAWVGFIVRLGLLIVLLVPLVLAIYFWRRVTTQPTGRSQNEPRDAEWIEVGPGDRRRK